MDNYNKLGKKIGEGGNAEVFEWKGHDKVIKLAKSNIDKWALQKEFNNTLAVWEMGLPVAKPIKIVVYNNRPGIVSERVHGESLMDRMIRNLVDGNNEPSAEVNDVRLIARSLSEVHRLSHPNLLNQKKYLKAQINNVDYLSDKEKERIIEKLERLPVKNKFVMEIQIQTIFL